jgi:predicted nucleotidyltransferase
MLFWVQSLTAFKKNFFGIEDKLSFERACYVQDRDGKMVRLQNIRFIATLDMRHNIVFRTPLLSVPAHKCLLKPTQMHANNKPKQRKHLTAQYVSRLLFVYKQEYPDPEECTGWSTRGVPENTRGDGSSQTNPCRH